MIVLFWSKATRDLLRSFGWGICRFRKIVRRFEATPIAPFCKRFGGRIGDKCERRAVCPHAAPTKAYAGQ